jgi:hypothetical protein
VSGDGAGDTEQVATGADGEVEYVCWTDGEHPATLAAWTRCLDCEGYGYRTDTHRRTLRYHVCTRCYGWGGALLARASRISDRAVVGTITPAAAPMGPLSLSVVAMRARRAG